MAEDQPTDALVREFMHKVAQISVQSRIKLAPDAAINGWFNLELAQLSSVQAAVESELRRAQGVHTNVQIDIAVRAPSLRQPILLERWSVHHVPYDLTMLPKKVDRANMYKRMIILIRSVFSYSRMLPAYQLYKLSPSIAMDQSVVRTSTNSFELFFNISTQSTGLQVFDEPPANYIFGNINTSTGKLHVSVLYRKDCSFEFTQNKPTAIARHVIQDYIPLVAEAKEPSAASLSRRSSLPVTAMPSQQQQQQQQAMQPPASDGSSASSHERRNSMERRGTVPNIMSPISTGSNSPQLHRIGSGPDMPNLALGPSPYSSSPTTNRMQGSPLAPRTDQSQMGNNPSPPSSSGSMHRNIPSHQHNSPNPAARALSSIPPPALNLTPSRMPTGWVQHSTGSPGPSQPHTTGSRGSPQPGQSYGSPILRSQTHPNMPPVPVEPDMSHPGSMSGGAGAFALSQPDSPATPLTGDSRRNASKPMAIPSRNATGSSPRAGYGPSSGPMAIPPPNLSQQQQYQQQQQQYMRQQSPQQFAYSPQQREAQFYPRAGTSNAGNRPRAPSGQNFVVGSYGERGTPPFAQSYQNSLNNESPVQAFGVSTSNSPPFAVPGSAPRSGSDAPLFTTQRSSAGGGPHSNPIVVQVPHGPNAPPSLPQSHHLSPSPFLQHSQSVSPPTPTSARSSAARQSGLGQQHSPRIVNPGSLPQPAPISYQPPPPLPPTPTLTGTALLASPSFGPGAELDMLDLDFANPVDSVGSQDMEAVIGAFISNLQRAPGLQLFSSSPDAQHLSHMGSTDPHSSGLTMGPGTRVVTADALFADVQRLAGIRDQLSQLAGDDDEQPE